MKKNKIKNNFQSKNSINIFALNSHISYFEAS